MFIELLYFHINLLNDMETKEGFKFDKIVCHVNIHTTFEAFVKTFNKIN